MDKELFLRKYEVEPVLDWDANWSAASAKGITREQYFNIWKDSFLCDPAYLSMTASSPIPRVMSYEDFAAAYAEMRFMDMELKNVERRADGVFEATCYATVEGSSPIVGALLSGKQRIDIIGLHGAKGWKIVAFAIDL